VSEEFKKFDQRPEGGRPEASVVIATCNQGWCIGKVLEALSSQSYKNFEIVIADDGSTDDTHDVALKCPLFLITQENRGFRKTRIANEASKNVKSDYIILLDGDCVPHRDFVKAHVDAREPGRFLAGRRIDIPRRLSEEFLAVKPAERIERFLLKNFWKIKKMNRITACRNPLIRKLFRQDEIHDMMGCNGSFWREDFIRVDGYDERYVKAHREDGDLSERLKNSGLTIKSVKGLALVYHLWHERQPYYVNEDIYHETIAEKRIRAVKGLSSR